MKKYRIPRKYVDLRWDVADRIAAELRQAGVDLVTSEHVRVWRPDLVQCADAWATRERMVRAGETRTRLVCPSFLYRLYASEGRKEELMNRGPTGRRDTATCSRVKNNDQG